MVLSHSGRPAKRDAPHRLLTLQTTTRASFYRSRNQRCISLSPPCASLTIWYTVLAGAGDLDQEHLQLQLRQSHPGFGNPFPFGEMIPLVMEYTSSDSGLDACLLTWLLTLTARLLLLCCFEWSGVRPLCGYLFFHTELRRRDLHDSMT